MSDNNLNKIQKCLNHVLQKEGFHDINLEIEGQTGKGDGYTGEIFFVKVTATSKKNTKEILHLAIKCSVEMESGNNENVFTGIYTKEMHIYENVKLAYLDFLKEHNISSDNLNFMSRCYGSYSDTSKMLVFENLKLQGFDLWDKAVTMPDEYVQLVLESYGKLHALSMALRNQKPDLYKELIQDDDNFFGNFMVNSKFVDVAFQEFQNALSAIKFEDAKILKGLQFSQDDFKYGFLDMFYEDPEYRVILHGDCWNNNFMFKPTKDGLLEVRILDWQCSGLGSPVFDLSYFIYACANNRKHLDVKPLLRIYYKSFSEFLQQLGGSPEETFPFEKLVEHWRRFSRFGFFLSSLGARICTMKSKDDLPDIKEAVNNGKEMKDAFNFDPSTDPDFLERCKNNFLHYYKNAVE